MDEHLFDLSEAYDVQLARGLQLSGEDKNFFIAGRVRELQRRLPQGFTPHRILDFGCGTGDTTRHLAGAFPEAEVFGLDTAEKVLAHAQQTHGSPKISFGLIRDFKPAEAFDLCYVNGVFHHIHPQRRLEAAAWIRGALQGGAYLALFENNPWNPGTRWVMSRIPFDRDAQPLSPPEARRLLIEVGFPRCAPTRFLFYFPRPLKFLRFSEPWLANLPLGAQYFILATKA